jgi:hypothetical protein
MNRRLGWSTFYRILQRSWGGVVIVLGAITAGYLLGADLDRALFRASGIWLALMVVFLNITSLRCELERISPRMRLVLAGVVAVMITGQSVGNSARTWPFPAWDMYASRNPRNSYIEYEATLATGERCHFPFEKFSPQPSVRAFMSRFNQKVFEVLDFDLENDSQSSHGRLLESRLMILMTLYNQRHTENPIEQVIVQKVEVLRRPDGVYGDLQFTEIAAITAR